MQRFNYYVEGRAFEWVLALSMLFLSAEIFICPNTLQSGLFPIILAGVSPRAAGVVLFVLGWAKGCGLMLNGQKIANVKAGPYTRAGSSVLSAVMWGQCTLAMIQGSIDRGRPAVVLPFFFMFMLGELYIAYTTVKNARRAN